MEIVNLVNGAYQPLSLRVVLKELVLWSTDHVNASQSSRRVLHEFSRYKAMGEFARHDIALLVTSSSWGQVLGLAFTRSACERIYGSAIVSDRDQRGLRTAWVATHEIGHSLGMDHVEDFSNCTCRRQGGCVMNAVLSNAYSSQLLDWSSCSVDAWRSQVEAVWRSCLHDAPVSHHGGGGGGGGVCGNGIVEAREQCDCGPALTCASNCCDAATCQLKGNATCASGGCCDWAACRLRQRGAVCRQSRGDCDLAEACDGQSEWCPGDDWVADGVECSRGEAYCHAGACRSHNASCSRLLSVPLAHAICNGMNTRAKFYGHCSFSLQAVEAKPDRTTLASYQFMGCGDEQDTSCGLLQCSAPSGRRASGTALLRYSDSISCYTPPVYDLSQAGLRSPTLVPDGAACGERRDKMCVNSICVQRPSVSDCHRRGVAARNGGCYCDAGYAPPDCAAPGCGGSVASPLACAAGSTK